MNEYTPEQLNNLYTQAGLARVLNVSKPYISKLVKDGVLTFQDKKIKLSIALELIKSNSNPAYNSKVVNSSDNNKKELPSEIISHLSNLDFNEARTLKERYLAGLAELDYLTKQKKLVDIEEVKKDAYNVARKLRDNLFNIGERLSDILAAEQDPIKVREYINNEVRTILNNIEEELKQ